MSRAPISTSNPLKKFYGWRGSLNLRFNFITNKYIEIKLQDATKRDAQLSKIMTQLRSSNLINSEYTIDPDILFKRNGVIVPDSLHRTA